VRVITFNIHKWRTSDDQPNFRLLVDLLKRVNADVIGLNEVLHPFPTETSAALSCLADELGMYVAFGAPEPRRQLDPTSTGGSGDALLSRFPFVSTAWAPLLPIPDKKQRGFLEVRLALGAGQTCTVVSLHLDHTDERARQGQFSDLLAWYHLAGRRPDLIVGDCNCIHPREYEDRPDAFRALSSDSIARHLTNGSDGPQLTRQIEQAGYVDALIQKGVLGQGTMIRAGEPVRLDYIWLRADWAHSLTHAEIVEEPVGQEASDHRPVVAEFEFLESSAGRRGKGSGASFR
jgi:endonuclease/exonuclease/phosphatase family metal-dependent hydrolase